MWDFILSVLIVCCAPVPVLPFGVLAYFCLRDADGVVRM